MIDYNDGNWHPWNEWGGTESKVHPESKVDCTLTSGTTLKNYRFCDLVDFGLPFLFRVTKPYREPQEMWMVGNRGFPSEKEASEYLSGLRRYSFDLYAEKSWEPRLFREVLE